MTGQKKIQKSTKIIYILESGNQTDRKSRRNENERLKERMKEERKRESKRKNLRHKERRREMIEWWIKIEKIKDKIIEGEKGE